MKKAFCLLIALMTVMMAGCNAPGDTAEVKTKEIQIRSVHYCLTVPEYFNAEVLEQTNIDAGMVGHYKSDMSKMSFDLYVSELAE